MRSRRDFLTTLLAASFSPGLGAQRIDPQMPWFNISLAEWSLHRMLFSGALSHLDFPGVARREFNIDVVEYVNQFFIDKAADPAYLAALKQRCDDNGVRSALIMCDSEGNLGDPDPVARITAVENHYKWAAAAAELGCSSIRVNATSAGSYEEQQALVADGLRRLCEFAVGYGINVIVENHGGLSSNGGWLAAVIAMVDMPNCGTLPDFGNFAISAEERYDPYRGMLEMMPYAKGVSAKAYAFDAAGNETQIDYPRMLQIVREAGYRGNIGIEFEGTDLDERAGIRRTKALLERVLEQLDRNI